MTWILVAFFLSKKQNDNIWSVLNSNADIGVNRLNSKNEFAV
jgi:hypothetical protein